MLAGQFRFTHANGIFCGDTFADARVCPLMRLGEPSHQGACEVWDAAGLLDPDLSCSSVFKLYRTDVPNRRVPTRRVVEPLDVIEHICRRLLARAVDLASRALRLQATEEALHCRVVPDFASTAHAAHDALLSQQPKQPTCRDRFHR